MPLRLRLALLFAAATALAIFAAGAVFLYQLRDNLDDALDKDLHARLSATVDELATEGRVLSFGHGGDFTRVENPDGTVVAGTPEAAGFQLSTERRAAALSGASTFTTEVAGQPSRMLASSALLKGSRVVVVVGTGTDIADDAVERVRTALLVMGPIAVALAGIAAAVLAGAALRPVERMRQEAETIGEHDAGKRLAVPATGDEIAALAATMNHLLDRLRHALTRERRFVADASHELRTPLAILRAELELAARPGRTPEALRQAVREAGGETERLVTLTEDLLLLARADNDQTIMRRETVQLDELLATATRRGRARDRQPPVELDCPGDIQLSADREQLLRAVGNLLDNAIGHSPPGTTVRLVAACARNDQGVHGVSIEVTDTGPGVPEEFLPHAFERFQRAERARTRDSGGTGLGLSIVKTIAEAHGGSAELGNLPGKGALARLWLPATPHPHPRHDSAGPELSSPPHHPVDTIG
jgi:hypothetical protein